ncbi:MAG: hypothetical protein KDC92_16210 [Bacteroidetes bacterium]|nr:hypothetical protein [Bacteroidota bacterium]
MQNNVSDKQVLLLFSGGRDSFLSAALLIEQGYKVHMLTLENGMGLQADNAKHGAERIIAKYGETWAEFHGVGNISGIWREFFLPLFNLKPSETLQEYGELTMSQFHCLSCRMAMYVWAIIKAKQLGIKYLADGARQDQGFIVELPIYIEKLRGFLSNFELELLLPVFELDSDDKRKNQLLLRGFTPKTLEPQCLLGVALPEGKQPEKDVQVASMNFFDKVIEPRAKTMINENILTKFDLSGQFH